jgi:hypothetical protein
VAGLSIAPGDEISPQDLREHLAMAGFSPEDPVDEHGEFCVRGGVLDFYPASEVQPVRLEFIGDIVESIRRYDASTQRSLEALDRIVVSPQRELLPDTFAPDDALAFDRTATIIDYVRTAAATIVAFEFDDIREQARKSRPNGARAPTISCSAAGRRRSSPPLQLTGRRSRAACNERSAGPNSRSRMRPRILITSRVYRLSRTTAG